MFSNLIGNAMQYSPAESIIIVRIVGEANQVSVTSLNKRARSFSDPARTAARPSNKMMMLPYFGGLPLELDSRFTEWDRGKSSSASHSDQTVSTPPPAGQVCRQSHKQPLD
jgi:hypothetical protein